MMSTSITINDNIAITEVVILAELSGRIGVFPLIRTATYQEIDGSTILISESYRDSQGPVAVDQIISWVSSAPSQSSQSWGWVSLFRVTTTSRYVVARIGDDGSPTLVYLDGSPYEGDSSDLEAIETSLGGDAANTYQLAVFRIGAGEIFDSRSLGGAVVTGVAIAGVVDRRGGFVRVSGSTVAQFQSSFSIEVNAHGVADKVAPVQIEAFGALSYAMVSVRIRVTDTGVPA